MGRRGGGGGLPIHLLFIGHYTQAMFCVYLQFQQGRVAKAKLLISVFMDGYLLHAA